MTVIVEVISPKTLWMADITSKLNRFIAIKIKTEYMAYSTCVFD